MYFSLACSRYIIIILFTCFLLILSEMHFTDPLIHFYHLTLWTQIVNKTVWVYHDYKETEKLPVSAIKVLYHPLLRRETRACLMLIIHFRETYCPPSPNSETCWKDDGFGFFLSTALDLGQRYALLSGLKAHTIFAFLASSAILKCQCSPWNQLSMECHLNDSQSAG